MWCRLEIFVGLASFTGCLVSVDKLYLFYSTCFYKTMALLSDKWEPTNRYPQRWKKSVAQNPPKVCVQLPMFNETFVARRVIDYTCRMDYPRHAFEVPVPYPSPNPNPKANPSAKPKPKPGPSRWPEPYTPTLTRCSA